MERKEYFILINRQLEDNYVFTNTVQYDVYLCVHLRNPHFHCWNILNLPKQVVKFSLTDMVVTSPLNGFYFS